MAKNSVAKEKTMHVSLSFFFFFGYLHGLFCTFIAFQVLVHISYFLAKSKEASSESKRN